MILEKKNRKWLKERERKQIDIRIAINSIQLL